MNRIGIIEIGANSVTLMLSEVDDDGYFRIIDELNTSIRLYSDLMDGDELSSEKMNSALSTLRSFKSMCEITGVKKIIAVMSDSIRKVSNSSVLVDLIKNELLIDIQPLKSDKEIYFSYLGVTNSLYIKNSLIIDIEGASTHLLWVKDDEIKEKATLPIGSLSLTNEFNLRDRIKVSDIDSCKEYIKELLESSPWLKENKFDSVVGIGGTFQVISRVDRKRKRYPLDIAHNYVFSDIDVHEIYNILKVKDLKQRKAINGLPIDRADIIVGGSIIIDSVLKLTKTQRIVTSLNGVREGIMYDYLAKNYNYEKDILNYSILGISKTLNINKTHAGNVYWLSKTLYEALLPLHRLTDETYSKILKTASLLHDCGISVNYYNHHKHSFYVILNSPINGLDHKELLMSAAVAASHRNNDYALPLPPFTSIINKIDLTSIESLGVILKIAESLDRSLEGAVRNLEVVITDDSVKLLLTSNLDLELEIRQASRAKRAFKEIFRKDLIIEKV
ncbi:MAG: Ppx/GppA phosphatase family protein [Clostridium sp.]|uniref:Ppx/GppA phosphatase family protein n=1 Tax=Clostridium TaxID=1485 RepID=UPI002152321E|nr:Ppx/GppA phosphatase family protein [Clostridium sp. LY3-2]MCR6515154.1 Ppx/GppA family phosphatase [Clostridium sp. LY3-2]